MEPQGVSRREFIGGLALITASNQVGGVLQSGEGGNSQEMPYRALGKTGEKVSCIGLGGFHLGQSHLEEADAIKLFHAAIDRGINFSRYNNLGPTAQHVVPLRARRGANDAGARRLY
jgi:hypothetical protein